MITLRQCLLGWACIACSDSLNDQDKESTEGVLSVEVVRSGEVKEGSGGDEIQEMISPEDEGSVETEADPITENDDETCADGIDNDLNGYTDCEDYQCSRNPSVHVCVTESDNEACADGIDNDLNGYTDCEDYNCSRNSSVQVCN